MSAPTLLPPLSDGDVVGIVDDEVDDAETVSETLIDAGLKPVIVDLKSDPDLLIVDLKKHVRAVVCDHRLRRRVTYTGAEVVSRCMSRQLPAVLITTFANTADSAVIQKYKASIPKVLKRGAESTPEALRTALDLANAEVNGSYSKARMPLRTIVRTTDLEQADELYVDAFVSAWSVSEALRVPTELITRDTGLPPAEVANRRFLADVNIYAQSADDLYFSKFAVATEPPDDWMA